MANVKVAVRARPLSKREIDQRAKVIVEITNDTTSVVNLKVPEAADLDSRERVRHFVFDYSYWSVIPGHPRYASQEMVFQDLGMEAVDAVFDGYNACVFAYGQSGSGKTHTMMGDEEELGLTPRLCQTLFDKIGDFAEEKVTFRTDVSFAEIYNERVRDLLKAPSKRKSKQALKVRKHPKLGIYVQDLTRHKVTDFQTVLALLARGNENRSVAATETHEHSSRSHAIFTINFTQARLDADLPSEIVSKIHLVDLAGSERASTELNRNRLKEGGNINKSLVALGNVISALAEKSFSSWSLDSIGGSTFSINSSAGESVVTSPGSSPRRLRQQLFVPYRDSVLTWLLKDSLGGNSKTIMIATISPASSSYTETINTLRYAQRAKCIINRPIINEDPNVKLIRELRTEITRLRLLLAAAQVDNILPSPVDEISISEILNQNEFKALELTKSWIEKWHSIETFGKETEMCIRKSHSGIVVDSPLPHLVVMDNHFLSTGIHIYYLKQGVTVLGKKDLPSSLDLDIVVNERTPPEHCRLHFDGVSVTLCPSNEGRCQINGEKVCQATLLKQADVVQLGNHTLRFNNPDEVQRLKAKNKTLENGWNGCYSESLIQSFFTRPPLDEGETEIDREEETTEVGGRFATYTTTTTKCEALLSLDSSNEPPVLSGGQSVVAHCVHPTPGTRAHRQNTAFVVDMEETVISPNEIGTASSPVQANQCSSNKCLVCQNSCNPESHHCANEVCGSCCRERSTGGRRNNHEDGVPAEENPLPQRQTASQNGSMEEVTGVTGSGGAKEMNFQGCLGIQRLVDIPWNSPPQSCDVDGISIGNDQLDSTLLLDHHEQNCDTTGGSFLAYSVTENGISCVLTDSTDSGITSIGGSNDKTDKSPEIVGHNSSEAPTSRQLSEETSFSLSETALSDSESNLLECTTTGACGASDDFHLSCRLCVNGGDASSAAEIDLCHSCFCESATKTVEDIQTSIENTCSSNTSYTRATNFPISFPPKRVVGVVNNKQVQKKQTSIKRRRVRPKQTHREIKSKHFVCVKRRSKFSFVVNGLAKKLFSTPLSPDNAIATSRRLVCSSCNTGCNGVVDKKLSTEETNDFSPEKDNLLQDGGSGDVSPPQYEIMTSPEIRDPFNPVLLSDVKNFVNFAKDIINSQHIVKVLQNQAVQKDSISEFVNYSILSDRQHVPTSEKGNIKCPEKRDLSIDNVKEKDDNGSRSLVTGSTSSVSSVQRLRTEVIVNGGREVYAEHCASEMSLLQDVFTLLPSAVTAPRELKTDVTSTPEHSVMNNGFDISVTSAVSESGVVLTNSVCNAVEVDTTTRQFPSFVIEDTVNIESSQVQEMHCSVPIVELHVEACQSPIALDRGEDFGTGNESAAAPSLVASSGNFLSVGPPPSPELKRSLSNTDIQQSLQIETESAADAGDQSYSPALSSPFKVRTNSWPEPSQLSLDQLDSEIRDLQEGIKEDLVNEVLVQMGQEQLDMSKVPECLKDVLDPCGADERAVAEGLISSSKRRGSYCCPSDTNEHFSDSLEDTDDSRYLRRSQSLAYSLCVRPSINGCNGTTTSVHQNIPTRFTNGHEVNLAEINVQGQPEQNLLATSPAKRKESNAPGEGLVILRSPKKLIRQRARLSLSHDSDLGIPSDDSGSCSDDSLFGKNRTVSRGKCPRTSSPCRSRSPSPQHMPPQHKSPSRDKRTKQNGVLAKKSPSPKRKKFSPVRQQVHSATKRKLERRQKITCSTDLADDNMTADSLDETELILSVVDGHASMKSTNPKLSVAPNSPNSDDDYSTTDTDKSDDLPRQLEPVCGANDQDCGARSTTPVIFVTEASSGGEESSEEETSIKEEIEGATDDDENASYVDDFDSYVSEDDDSDEEDEIYYIPINAEMQAQQIDKGGDQNLCSLRNMAEVGLSPGNLCSNSSTTATMLDEGKLQRVNVNYAFGEVSRITSAAAQVDISKKQSSQSEKNKLDAEDQLTSLENFFNGTVTPLALNEASNGKWTPQLDGHVGNGDTTFGNVVTAANYNTTVETYAASELDADFEEDLLIDTSEWEMSDFIPSAVFTMSGNTSQQSSNDAFGDAVISHMSPMDMFIDYRILSPSERRRLYTIPELSSEYSSTPSEGAVGSIDLDTSMLDDTEMDAGGCYSPASDGGGVFYVASAEAEECTDGIRNCDNRGDDLQSSLCVAEKSGNGNVATGNGVQTEKEQQLCSNAVVQHDESPQLGEVCSVDLGSHHQPVLDGESCQTDKAQQQPDTEQVLLLLETVATDEPEVPTVNKEECHELWKLYKRYSEESDEEEEGKEAKGADSPPPPANEAKGNTAEEENVFNSRCHTKLECTSPTREVYMTNATTGEKLLGFKTEVVDAEKLLNLSFTNSQNDSCAATSTDTISKDVCVLHKEVVDSSVPEMPADSSARTHVTQSSVTQSQARLVTNTTLLEEMLYSTSIGEDNSFDNRTTTSRERLGWNANNINVPELNLFTNMGMVVNGGIVEAAAKLEADWKQIRNLSNNSEVAEEITIDTETAKYSGNPEGEFFLSEEMLRSDDPDSDTTSDSDDLNQTVISVTERVVSFPSQDSSSTSNTSDDYSREEQTSGNNCCAGLLCETNERDEVPFSSSYLNESLHCSFSEFVSDPALEEEYVATSMNTIALTSELNGNTDTILGNRALMVSTLGTDLHREIFAKEVESDALKADVTHHLPSIDVRHVETPLAATVEEEHSFNKRNSSLLLPGDSAARSVRENSITPDSLENVSSKDIATTALTPAAEMPTPQSLTSWSTNHQSTNQHFTIRSKPVAPPPMGPTQRQRQRLQEMGAFGDLLGTSSDSITFVFVGPGSSFGQETQDDIKASSLQSEADNVYQARCNAFRLYQYFQGPCSFLPRSASLDCINLKRHYGLNQFNLTTRAASMESMVPEDLMGVVERGRIHEIDLDEMNGKIDWAATDDAKSSNVHKCQRVKKDCVWCPTKAFSQGSVADTSTSTASLFPFARPKKSVSWSDLSGHELASSDACSVKHNRARFLKPIIKKSNENVSNGQLPTSDAAYASTMGPQLRETKSEDYTDNDVEEDLQNSALFQRIQRKNNPCSCAPVQTKPGFLLKMPDHVKARIKRSKSEADVATDNGLLQAHTEPSTVTELEPAHAEHKEVEQKDIKTDFTADSQSLLSHNKNNIISGTASDCHSLLVTNSSSSCEPNPDLEQKQPNKISENSTANGTILSEIITKFVTNKGSFKEDEDMSEILSRLQPTLPAEAASPDWGNLSSLMLEVSNLFNQLSLFCSAKLKPPSVVPKHGEETRMKSCVKQRDCSTQTDDCKPRTVESGMVTDNHPSTQTKGTETIESDFICQPPLSMCGVQHHHKCSFNPDVKYAPGFVGMQLCGGGVRNHCGHCCHEQMVPLADSFAEQQFRHLAAKYSANDSPMNEFTLNSDLHRYYKQCQQLTASDSAVQVNTLDLNSHAREIGRSRQELCLRKKLDILTEEKARVLKLLTECCSSSTTMHDAMYHGVNGGIADPLFNGFVGSRSSNAETPLYLLKYHSRLQESCTRIVNKLERVAKQRRVADYVFNDTNHTPPSVSSSSSPPSSEYLPFNHIFGVRQHHHHHHHHKSSSNNGPTAFSSQGFSTAALPGSLADNSHNQPPLNCSWADLSQASAGSLPRVRTGSTASSASVRSRHSATSYERIKPRSYQAQLVDIRRNLVAVSRGCLSNRSPSNGLQSCSTPPQQQLVSSSSMSSGAVRMNGVHKSGSLESRTSSQVSEDCLCHGQSPSSPHQESLPSSSTESSAEDIQKLLDECRAARARAQVEIQLAQQQLKSQRLAVKSFETVLQKRVCAVNAVNFSQQGKRQATESFV